MIAHITTMAATVMLLAGGAFSAGPTPVQSQPAGTFAGSVCVAIIEPEVAGNLPADHRKSMAGVIDSLLTECLAKEKAIVLVDRQALDKVLDEHKSVAAGSADVRKGGTAGAARLTAEQIGQPLRPFWSAGVLVCTSVDLNAKVIFVEAVSAQTGQLIASLSAGCKTTSVDDVAKALQPRIHAFAEGIVSGSERAHDKPLLEISGKLSGGLMRLAWMVDDFTEAAGAMVSPSNKAVWLVPRQPLVTKEERLLRIMGLGEAREGDSVAGLSPVPEIRLTFELADSGKTGVAFEKTPISLKLSLRRGQDKPAETQIAGEVGHWEACRDKAVSWLGAQLAAIDGGAGSEARDDGAIVKQLAADELAAVEQWAQLGYYEQKELVRTIRMRVARHALRAAHLDPSNEQAAYLVACHVDALYDGNTKESILQAADRSITEAQRYIDRFKRKDPRHHREVIYVIGSVSVGALWKIRGGAPPKDDISRPPITEGYPYARAMACTHADAFCLVMTDKRYAGNTFSNFSFELINYLVPCIPEDRLDEEYEYWRAYYATKIDKIVRDQKLSDFLNARPAPWDLVDAAFQARRKDPAGVREAFQRLARDVPASQTIIWGGDAHSPARIPLYLKAAGDAEPQNWRPEFGVTREVKVSLNEMTALMSSLRATTPDCWDYASLPSLVGTDLVVPGAVRDMSEEKDSFASRSVEAVLVAGDDVWLTSPGIFAGNSAVNVRLFVAVMKPEGDGRMALDAQEIAWPSTDKIEGKPHWSYAYAVRHRDKWVAFMGTDQHGLARFDKADGKWTGKWITTKHGLPSNGVNRLALCVNGAQTELLVLGGHSGVIADGAARRETYMYMVSALNLDTDKVTLIRDGSKDTANIYHPTAVMKDGSKVLLELSGSTAYSKPADIGEIVKLVPSGIGQMSEVTTPYTIAHNASGDETRLWWPNWDGPNRRHNLTELNPRTLEPVRGAGPPPGSTRSVSVAMSDQVPFVLGLIAAWPEANRRVVMDRWPNKGAVFAVGGRDVLWMAFNTDTGWDWSRCIVGYRPAPPGTKDWAREDQWIGPFKTPNSELIVGFRQESGGCRLLLSTVGHVMLLEEEQLLAEAKKRGAARSTQQWSSEYDARLAKTGWQSLVPAMILDRRYDEAIRLLDGREKELPADATEKQAERHVVALWRARVFADAPGKIDQAIAIYEALATGTGTGGALEAFARANQIVLLHRAGRWQDVLDLAGKVQARFPQMKATSEGVGMGWCVADSRKHLAAQTQPGTRTTTNSAIAPVR